MPLTPPKEPIIRPGRPKIEGYHVHVLIPDSLYKRIEEYRQYTKNKVGARLGLSLAIKTLLDIGLEKIGIPENESSDDEANCG